MSIKVTIDSFTPSAVTVEEAKHYCRVDTTTDDAMIADLIESSQEEGLGYTHVVFGDAAITLTAYGYRACIQLPYLPYVLMTSFKLDGVDSTKYTVKGDKVYIEATDWEELIFTYDAGRSMPADIKTAILQRVKFYYDFPDDMVYTETRMFERIFFRYREPNTFT